SRAAVRHGPAGGNRAGLAPPGERPDRGRTCLRCDDRNGRPAGGLKGRDSCGVALRRQNFYLSSFYPPPEDSMARVTVEDCIEKVPNRFSLVLLASHRARAISAGAQILVDRDNDKNPVVSLREIADDVVDAEELRENLIGTLQRVDERSEAEEEAET